jgi:hypothetical protein
MQATGTPGSFLETFENRAWDTAYVVDPSITVGLRGTFSTIQAALNAAVVDGMAFTNPKKIKLRPATYVEDLTIPDGAYLSADDIAGDQDIFTQPVVIEGQHIVDDSAVFYCQGIKWNATATAIFTSGTDLFSLLAIDCMFFADDPIKFIASTAAITIMKFTNCDFGGSIIASTQKITYTGGYTITFDDCRLGNSGITADGIALEMFNCISAGEIIISGGVPRMKYCSLLANTGANITMNANETGGVIDSCSFISNDPVYAIAGTHANLVSVINSNIPNTGSGPLDFYDPTSASKPLVLVQTGNVLTSVRQTAIDYIAEGPEGYIGITDTAAPRAITLTPRAKDQFVYVADESGGAGTNAITISAGGGATINGAASVTINENYGAILFLAVSPTLFVVASRTINTPVSVAKGGTGSTGITGIVAGSGTAYAGRTITSGGNIDITNANGSAGNPSLTVTGGGYIWNNVTGASQTLFARNGYFANNAGSRIDFNLGGLNIGDAACIVGVGAAGWRLNANGSSKQIRIGTLACTVSTGYIESTNQYDCVEVIALNTTLVFVRNSIGNINVV